MCRFFRLDSRLKTLDHLSKIQPYLRQKPDSSDLSGIKKRTNINLI